MKSENKIKAVLMDGGNILFDDSESKNELFNYLNEMNFIYLGSSPDDPKLAVPYAEKISLDAVTKEKFHSIYTKYKVKAQTEEGYARENAYRDTLKELGLEHLYDAFMRRVEERKSELRKQGKKPKQRVDGVKETLEELSRNGRKVIILTDATKHGNELKEQLSRLGYGDEIADIISSKDVHTCKPDSKFFQAALDKYGLKKDEVVFVAHDVDELEGASKLGYKSVAFRYRKEDLPKLKDVQYKIDNPSGLLEIVLDKKK